MNQLINRRQALSLFGVAGVASLAEFRRGSQAWAAACATTTPNDLGPYFVDELLERSDITVDPTTGLARPGVPLRFDLRVLRADDSCTPAAGVQVDIWHCDAGGLYSDESANGTTGRKFLRGYQVTDADGIVQFTTIYPGWYPGRTIHIHYRLRVTGTTYDFVSQVFFPETISNQVLANAPYSGRGTRNTTNANDHLYTAGGLLTLAAGSGGWTCTFDIGATGLPATTTTTTVPGSSTTTTTLPSCSTSATFAAALCQTTTLRATADTTLSANALRTRLLRIIDQRVQPSITHGDGFFSSGSTRRAQIQLRRAQAGVRSFRSVLASRMGRNGADDTTRATLDALALQLVTVLAGLRQTLAATA